MASDFTRGIKVYIDSQLYGKSMKEMTSYLQKYRQQLQGLIDQGSGATREADRLRQSIQRLEKTQNTYLQEINETKRVLSNLSGATYNQLFQVRNRLRSQLREMTPGTEQYRQVLETLRQTQTRLTLATQEMNLAYTDQRGLFARLSSTLNKYFLIISTAISSMTALILAGRKSVQAFMDVEEHLAKIRKYAGLTIEEVHRLSRELDDLSTIDTRTAHLELLDLAADAGRLGIKGVDNIKAFVTAADKINLALGEDLGEDAVTNIGKLANLFGEDERIGLEDAMLSTASAVTKLAKSSTACEPYLVNFASRLGGIGAVAGISTGDILGLGSALDQNMQKVEMSSTALMTLITKIFQEPSKFARLAGRDVEEFSRLVREDANEALLQFLTSMREKGGFDALAPMFADMEMSGKRAIQVLSTLSSHVDQVRQAQLIANDAYEKNTEVEHEFSIINNTVQAQLDKRKKQLQQLRVELGEQLMPVLSHIRTAQSLLLRSLKSLVTFFINNRTAIISVTAAYLSCTLALKAHVIHQKLVALWNDRIIIGLKKLRIALMRNPWTAIITALAGVVAHLMDVARRTREAREEYVSLDALRKDASKGVDRQTQSLKSLLSVLAEEDLNYERKMAAISDIVAMNPQFLGCLASEATTYDTASRAVATYISYLQKQAEMEALMGRRDENIEKMKELVDDIEHPTKQIAESRFKQALRNILYRVRSDVHAEFHSGTYTDDSGDEYTYDTATREQRKQIRNDYFVEEWLSGDSPFAAFKRLREENAEIDRQMKELQDEMTDMLLDAQVTAEMTGETVRESLSPDTVKDLYEGTGGIIDTLDDEYSRMQHELDMALAKREITQSEHDLRSASLEATHQTALTDAWQRYQQALSDIEFEKEEDREKAMLAAHKKEEKAEEEHDKAIIRLRESLTKAWEGFGSLSQKSEPDETERLKEEYEKRKLQAAEYYRTISTFIMENIRETTLASSMMLAAETAYFNTLESLSHWYNSTRREQDYKTALEHYRLLKKYGHESLQTELRLELEQLDLYHEAGLLSEEEYQSARQYLIDSYSDRELEEKRKIRQQYGLLTLRDSLQMEMEQLDAVHRKGLLSEEEYQKARRRLILDSTMDIYGRMQSYASTMVESLQDMELAAVEKRYAIEIRAAENAGEDTAELEMQQANAKLEIQKKYALSNLLVKLSQITADTAVAIMQGFAELGPIGGAAAAAMLTATGLAQYSAALSEYQQIKAISLQSTPASASQQMISDTGLRVVQYAAGRYDVIGEDDGRLYRDVPYIGQAPTGIVERPALISETGRELIVSAPVLERLRVHPDFAFVVSAINDAREGRIRQHAEGAYPLKADVRPSSTAQGPDLAEILLSIAERIDRLPREQRSYVLLDDLNRKEELSRQASQPFRRKDS